MAIVQEKKSYTDELASGQKLNVSVSSNGSASVRLFQGGSQISATQLTANSSNYFGPFINPISYAVDCYSGTATINESDSTENIAETSKNANGDLSALLDGNGGVAQYIIQPFTLPDPVLVDSYNSGTGTTSGSVDTIAKSQPDTAAQVGKTLVTSTSAGTTTINVDKVTTRYFNPSKMGVIATCLAVNGKKSGRVINMRDSAGANGTNVILADNATTPLVRDGYLWLANHVSEFTNFAALTTPQAISPRIGVQLSGNDGVTTARPGPMWCNAAGRSKVSITFDDVHASTHTIAWPVMESLGLVASVFVPSAYVGTSALGFLRLTVSQLRDLKSAGWAICVNGTSDDGNLVSTDLAVAVNDLNVGRDFLISNGLSSDGSENHGCWPNNNWDESRILAFESAGMLTMRSTTGWTVYDRFGLGSIALTLPSYSAGKSGSAGASFAGFKAVVDQAVLRGSSVHFHFHQIVASGASGLSQDLAQFTEMMTYLKQLVDANTIDVVNRTQYWDAVKDNQPPVIY